MKSTYKRVNIHKIQYQAMFKLWAVNRKTHKEGKLVRILARSRHPDSARPVVVEMGELVGERLDVLRQQPRGVLHHIVGGRVDSALVHRLRHEEEVVPKQEVHHQAQFIKQSKPLRQGHITVHHSSTWWVGRLTIHPAQR